MFSNSVFIKCSMPVDNKDSAYMALLPPLPNLLRIQMHKLSHPCIIKISYKFKKGQ